MAARTTLRTLSLAALALATLSVAPSQARAQENFFGAEWITGAPVGDASDYISSYSFAGFGIDYRRFMASSYSFGFYGGWQVFNQREFTLVQGSLQGEPISGTLSGEQFRFLNTFPLMATAHYYAGPSYDLKFFAGGGVGTVWAERRTEMGLRSATSTTWHLAASPEIGFMVQIGFGGYLYAKARYNWMTESDGIQNQSYGFSIGFAGRGF